jgi:hypothetical protein
VILFSEQSRFIRASKTVEGPATNGSNVLMVKELEYHISHKFAQRVKTLFLVNPYQIILFVLNSAFQP